MKRYVLALLVISMVAILAVSAMADTTTIQRGTNGTVRDAYIRLDGNPDTNFGNPADPTGLRLYPDSGYGSKGPRHNLQYFDVSGIAAGSTITSAVMGIYYNGSGADVTGLKVSKLRKSWVEGTGDIGATAIGDPTWNQQQFGQTNWEVAGATGATDIDLSDTKTYDVTGGVAGFRTVDITSFVNAWVNGGVTNNGLLMWGGVGVQNPYWLELPSEYSTVNMRPYLTITYTPAPVPEPGSLLALAGFGIAGFGMMRRRRA